MARGVSSVRIAETREKLLTLYKDALAARVNDLFLQEYIPDRCAEDWIFHGYANPQSGMSYLLPGENCGRIRHLRALRL
jgi:hypothetical protein